jgi:hypothetical protein
MSKPKVIENQDEDIETAILYPQGTATAVKHVNENATSSCTWKRILGVGFVAFVGFAALAGFCHHRHHHFFPFGRHHHHHHGHSPWNHDHDGHRHHGHHGHRHHPDEMMMEHEGFSGDMMMKGPHNHMHHKPHFDHHGMMPHDKKHWDLDGKPQHKRHWEDKHHLSFSGSSSSSSSSDSFDEEEHQIIEIVVDSIPEMDEDPELFDGFDEDGDFVDYIEVEPQENTNILEELESEMAQSGEEKVSRMEGSP